MRLPLQIQPGSLDIPYAQSNQPTNSWLGFERANMNTKEMNQGQNEASANQITERTAREKPKLKTKLEKQLYEDKMRLVDRLEYLERRSVQLDVLLSKDNCLGRLKFDEPIFVLRAQDRLASVVIRMWADLAATERGEKNNKIFEALGKAERMDRWGNNNRRQMPD